MPCSTRRSPETLQNQVPLHVPDDDDDDDVDVEPFDFAQLLRKENAMDRQLKEAIERRRLKAVAAAAVEAAAKSEPLETKAIKHPQHAEKAEAAVTTPGILSQKQKPEEELRAQRRLQPMHEQELSDMTGKLQRGFNINSASKGNAVRMQISNDKSKGWNSSWQNAEGHREMHRGRSTWTYIDNESQETCYANGPSQPKQHTQQLETQTHFARTPSPPPRAASPTIEGYMRMATLLQEAQCKQHQQDRQSWPSQDTCVWKQNVRSWEEEVTEREQMYGKQPVKSEPTSFGQDAEQAIEYGVSSKVHALQLTRFELVEYGIVGSGGMPCIDDM